MTRKQKKSETLEIRVSYETKQALQKKAADEGQTVSAVIRNLINDYLAPTGHEAKQVSTRFKPVLVTGGALSAVGTALIAFFGASAPAIAEDVHIALNTDFSRTVGDGMRTSSTQWELLSKFDEMQKFDVPFGDSHVTLALKVVPQEEGRVAISLSLLDKMKMDNPVLAKPVLLARYGETARIEIGDEKERYEISMTPQKAEDYKPGC